MTAEVRVTVDSDGRLWRGSSAVVYGPAGAELWSGPVPQAVPGSRLHGAARMDVLLAEHGWRRTGPFADAHKGWRTAPIEGVAR